MRLVLCKAAKTERNSVSPVLKMREQTWGQLCCCKVRRDEIPERREREEKPQTVYANTA